MQTKHQIYKPVKNTRIFKYILEATDLQEVDLPNGAKILTVEWVGDELCLYAAVNPEEEGVDVKHIRIFATGHEMNYEHNLNYIGTAISTIGGHQLVWHVFEDYM